MPEQQSGISSARELSLPSGQGGDDKWRLSSSKSQDNGCLSSDARDDSRCLSSEPRHANGCSSSRARDDNGCLASEARDDSRWCLILAQSLALESWGVLQSNNYIIFLI